MTIVWGILCLGLIVFVHELGHFIAARLCGVKVENFSIGMGPVLAHKTIGERIIGCHFYLLADIVV